MAETIETAAQPTQDQPSIEQPAKHDLSQLEKMLFPEPPPVQNSFGQMPAAEAPPAETPAAAPEVVAPVVEAPVADAFDWKSLGYGTADELKADLELAKKAKASPNPEPPKIYKDEAAERLAQAINEGKYEEVQRYVQAQTMLSGVENMNTEQKLKLMLKIENPRYDAEMIEEEFLDRYRVKEENFADDPAGLRKAKIRLEQKMDNDVAAADDVFAKYKQKTELPAIKAPEVQVDPDYEDFKASTAEYQEVIEKVVVPGINALKETDVKFNYQLKDENNNMDFNFDVVVTPEDMKRAKEIALNWNSYLTKIQSDANGNFSPTNIAAFILKAENADKYAQAFARHAVNQERLRVLSAATPDSTQRTVTEVQENPLAAIEKAVFSV